LPDIERESTKAQEISTQTVTDEIATQTGKTTVVLHNVPRPYSQVQLLQEVNEFGFEIDFLYLPPARHNSRNLGYAFCNLVNPGDVDDFIKEWKGHTWKYIPTSPKVADVSYSALQGVEDLCIYFSENKVNKAKFRPYLNNLVWLRIMIKNNHPSSRRKSDKN
jgi:hypothetical protein